MKTAFLVIITVLAGYFFLRSDLSPRKVPQAKTEPLERTIAATKPVPRYTPFVASPERRNLQIKDLEIAKGRVEAVTSDGIILNCTQTEARVGTGPGWRLPANAGAGDSARLATVAIMAEKARDNKIYGPLIILKAGRLGVSSVSPERKTEGLILLRGHPDSELLEAGRPLRVVAVPTGETYSRQDDNGRAIDLPVYSMIFGMSQGAWLWDPNRRQATDPPPRKW